MVLIIVAIILCCPLLYYSVQICKLIELKQTVIGAVKLSDLWKVALGGAVYQIHRVIIIRLTHNWHSRMCTKTDPLQRKRYIEKSEESSAKGPFHFIAFVWGYIVLYKCGWLPTELGGTISYIDLFTTEMVRAFPYGNPPQTVVDYSLYCAGYHASELIRHAIQEYHR